MSYYADYDPPDYDYYYDDLREPDWYDYSPADYDEDDALTTAEKAELEAQDSLMTQPRGCYFSSNGRLDDGGGIDLSLEDGHLFFSFSLKEARWLHANLAAQIKARADWERITGWRPE
jgi:hypothetical protein